jgi:peptide/nickel transport system permease protein
MAEMTDIIDQTVVLAPKPKQNVAAAGQWKLIWWRFRQHKLALISGVVIAIFAEFLAPVSSQTYDPRFTYAPPQQLKFFGTDAEGVFHPLYVNGYTVVVDPIALNRNYQTDPAVIIPVGLLVPGEPYKFWGLFDADRHLIGPVDRPFICSAPIGSAATSSVAPSTARESRCRWG